MDYRRYIINLAHNTHKIPKLDLYQLKTDEVVNIMYNRKTSKI